MQQKMIVDSFFLLVPLEARALRKIPNDPQPQQQKVLLDRQAVNA
jgi:hypothetical protein